MDEDTNLCLDCKSYFSSFIVEDFNRYEYMCNGCFKKFTIDFRRFPIMDYLYLKEEHFWVYFKQGR